MNYNLKGTGIDIAPELREYVEKRLAHADKFVGDDSTAQADVELAFEPQNDAGKYRAEFTLSRESDIFRASRFGATMHEAIDLAIGELTEELQRTKKKKLHVLRRSAVRVKEYLRGWRRKV